MRFLGNDPNILDAFYKATASGSIAAGKPVIVTADGKVKAITGASASVGSAATYESATVAQVSAAFDTAANKVVVAYRDHGNSQYGTAVVGTVSGASISFGTPVVFESAVITHTRTAFEASQGKAVITFGDEGDSFKAKAIAGTVSGTSISFGTAVEVDASYGDVTVVPVGSSKVVFSFQDGSNSNYGVARVGTLSGTSISLGSNATFESANSSRMSMAYDSTNDRVVIAYRDFANSSYLTAVVGTVSGTSISFGTPVVASSSSSTDYSATVFDSTNDRIAIAWPDSGDSSKGKAIVGTVSGTSISFGSAVEFLSATTLYVSGTFDSNSGKVIFTARNNDAGEAFVFPATISGTSISFDSAVSLGNVGYLGVTFDSSNNKTVVAYKDEADNYGKAVVFTDASTDLTTENYIGITDQAYTDGQDAAVAVVGCIDRNQTSLTAGQQYFVQNDGTLSTTAGSPSVLAGTAISATELVVKE